MIDFKDSVAENNKAMMRNKRLLKEGKIRGYDVFRGNAETIRVCLENKRNKGKGAVAFPDDPEERWEDLKKLFKISA